MIWLVIGIVVVVIITVAVIVAVMRRSRPDGVTAFRRQIDALSPEARRPVVDKVQQLEDEAGQAKPPDGDDRP